MIIQRYYNQKTCSQQEQHCNIISLFFAIKTPFICKLKKTVNIQTQQKGTKIHRMSEQIIKFLNKYTITSIDDHTSIISEYEHHLDYGNKNKYIDQSSLSFLMTDSRKQKNMYVNSNAPACFLVRDLIIEDQNQLDMPDTDRNGSNKRLETALETLSMHQQLSNKYILTLIHYQVFKKTIPSASHSAHIISNYEQENINDNQQVAHFPLGLHRQKQKIIKTRVQQSSYNEQSIDGDSFAQNYSREKSITNFSQCNNQNRSQNPHTNTNPNLQTNINTNVSFNFVGSQLRTAIRAIYQFGKITLKQEIKNRIISNTQFQEEELWAILATLVQALSYLEEQGIVYGVLGTDKIFINNSLVKILDPSATATDPLLIAQGRLYSPQILNDQQNIDMFKSDVYIIGMVLIECSLLINLSKEVEPNMNKYLSLFRQAYSQQLVDIVRLCLAIDPKNRPSFQDLKKYLAKQLDMNDFESAYDNTGAKILQPFQNDQEDIYNPTVGQIEIQFEQDNHDVLYQSIGEEQLKNRRKNLTEHDRARLKYLGLSGIEQIQNSYNSTSHNNSQSKSGQKLNRMQSQHKHRYTSSSPLQTKKNSKLPQQDNTGYFNFNNININSNGKTLPNLNVAISQSIYPDQCQNLSKNNSNSQKTNRKNHKKPQNEYEMNWMKAEKQNKGQQKTVPNSNQKQRLKKTKQIKQKLVRQQAMENNPNDQTFGPRNTKAQNTSCSNKDKPKLKPQISENPYYNTTTSTNKYQNSQIRQQIQQQSQSSYIYYNNTNNSNSNSHNNSNSNSNSNKMMKNKNGSIGNSQVSKNSQLNNSNGNGFNNKILKNSNRYRNQYQEQNNTNKQNNKYQYTSADCNKLINKIKQDQLFTDPNLLKTIKDDLARISTKNIRLMDKCKDRQKQREKQKYFN